ncbi:MAG: hypothetical protein PHY93_18970 [Bacteriovorax sp.]|nr:hypothetical protein [Bacteriovorax sp.]
MRTNILECVIKLKSFSYFLFLFTFLTSAQVLAAIQNNNNALSTELQMVVSDSTRQEVSQKINGKLSKNLLFTQAEMQILVNDLSALSELKGAQVNSPLYQEIFLSNQFDGKILIAWFFKKIQLLVPSRGAKCGGAIESKYVGCYSPMEKKISLPPLFFIQGRLNRLATLIHEARHADGFSHVLGSQNSEDEIINGSRGAEWSFLRGLSSSCINCRLMDKFLAYGIAKEVMKKIINLPSVDYATSIREIKLFKNPLDEKYTAIENSFKLERSFIFMMPTLCMNKVPYNEFKGNLEITPTEDCALLYYYVNSEDAHKNPTLLKRSLEMRNGLLIVLNPVEKK